MSYDRRDAMRWGGVLCRPDPEPGSVQTRHTDVNDPGRRPARSRQRRSRVVHVCAAGEDEPGCEWAAAAAFCTAALLRIA